MLLYILWNELMSSAKLQIIITVNMHIYIAVALYNIQSFIIRKCKIEYGPLTRSRSEDIFCSH